jgi:hypothetical protein
LAFLEKSKLRIQLPQTLGLWHKQQPTGTGWEQEEEKKFVTEKWVRKLLLEAKVIGN